jgi:hypothetical protein
MQLFERALPAVGLVLSLALAGGCSGGVGNDGGLVGGDCRDNADCTERCVRGGDFPDGTCTIDCNDDIDCPRGTACVEREGGICLLLCDFDRDCRPSYACEPISRHGHSGSASVCIDD